MTIVGTVITPTIGSPKLLDAIDSVSKQAQPNLLHYVIIDGEQYKRNVDIAVLTEKYPNLRIVALPENTGKNDGNFYGHRILAGFSHLVPGKYVFFLDEDNWYDENHCSSLISSIESNPLYLWGYSLRKIYTEKNMLACKDNCESLGKWPVWLDESKGYHIDTSAYAFKRDFLIKVASVWHQGYAGDRIFLSYMRQIMPPENYVCSGEYTLNYRLDGNPNSATIQFFHKGNEVVKYALSGGKMVPPKYPWRKKIL